MCNSSIIFWGSCLESAWFILDGGQKSSFATSSSFQYGALHQMFR
jgi:hypothetical protein